MPNRGGDAAIAALGVHRIPIPVPFPQAGGPVNVVAVEEEGGGIALFDSGVGTAEGEQALRRGLAELGWSFADVRRIFVTHGHVDHYGLVERIRAESQAPVFVHPEDRWKVAGPSPWRALADPIAAFLASLGIDPAFATQLATLAETQDDFAGRIDGPIADLQEGMRLRFARCEAEILHMPGHTPGLVCASLTPLGEGPRVLVADDHLLEKVSPNPILEVGHDGARFRALPHYFASLARIEAMEFDWIVPGHGVPFPEHDRVIAGLRQFYARRQEKLLARIPAEGASPLELVFALFPEARPLDLYLMLGEILGNLDLLEEANRVVHRVVEGQLRYERCGGP